MPQNEYIERWQKLHGRQLNAEERERKKAAREGHRQSKDAQNLRGLRAKLHQQKRHKEKIQMRKRIKAQEERNVKSTADEQPHSNPIPHYLLDRSKETNAKALSSAIKNKRNEKAAKWSVPLPKVRGISEEEMFKVVHTGKKTHKKSWKRVITKPTFVGQDFTRQAVKYERFIRPMGLRQKKANVTHPQLGVTVQLPIISVKKNPQNPLYTRLGVLTRGTVIEVNVSELGLVTPSGKVVWGKWAQITIYCARFAAIDNGLLGVNFSWGRSNLPLKTICKVVVDRRLEQSDSEHSRFIVMLRNEGLKLDYRGWGEDSTKISTRFQRSYEYYCSPYPRPGSEDVGSVLSFIGQAELDLLRNELFLPNATLSHSATTVKSGIGAIFRIWYWVIEIETHTPLASETQLISVLQDGKDLKFEKNFLIDQGDTTAQNSPFNCASGVCTHNRDYEVA
ncbi:Ribosome biogenesis protein [Myotisia sp. PD_48]|nr:Ribosome biogenesis protein [Myotisia sp. PD_48]